MKHKELQNQGLNKCNWELGVFAVLFKFSLVAEIGKWVIADGTKYFD